MSAWAIGGLCYLAAVVFLAWRVSRHPHPERNLIRVPVRNSIRLVIPDQRVVIPDQSNGGEG